jgi:hypothetical protein
MYLFEAKQVKQSASTFGVALGVALGLGFLTTLIMYSLRIMLMPENTIAYSIATSLFAPVYYVLSFLCFYQFGKKAKIFVAKKTTLLALLIGLMIGTTITSAITSSSTLPLATTISFIVTYSFTGALQYLFPALAGLLFAEIKEKRQPNLKVKSEKQNPINPDFSTNNFQ